MQRNRFVEIKPLFEEAGIDAWLVSDNLASDPTSLDYGSIALCVGLTEAAQHEEQAVSPVNAFSLVARNAASAPRNPPARELHAFRPVQKRM